jgi:hypothetical protein
MDFCETSIRLIIGPVREMLLCLLNIAVDRDENVMKADCQCDEIVRVVMTRIYPTLMAASDAEVMQRDLGRQAGRKATEVVRAFPVEAEGMIELLVDCLHHLANTC